MAVAWPPNYGRKQPHNRPAQLLAHNRPHGVTPWGQTRVRCPPPACAPAQAGFPRYRLLCDVSLSGLRLICASAGSLIAVVALAAVPGASASAPVPDCATTALAPTVRTNGAGGTIIIYAGLRNTSGRACFVRGRVLLALRDARTHRLLRIAGNPHAERLHDRLHRGYNTVFALQWSNYCGPGRPLILVVSFGRKQASERDSYPGARCESPAVPSTLRLFRLPR
jgi:hypothetical protein